MEAKFYIYARGRWCEVDPQNGRVEGFKEHPRFLYFKGGKLELASTAKVLRGLRALVAGTPGSVRDGPPLPQRRRLYRRRSRRKRDSRRRSHHHNCCAHRCDLGINPLVNRPVLPVPPTPPQPRKRRIIESDDSPQEIVKPPTNIPDTARNITQSSGKPTNNLNTGPSGIKPVNEASVIIDSDSSKEEKIKSGPGDKKQKNTAKNHLKLQDTKSAGKILLGVSDSEDSGRQTDDTEPAKELVIDERDVIVLRRFLAAKGIGDLERFDNDEDYKRRVFYKLNPLVMLQRSKSLEDLLRQKMTLKEFARYLGLRSVAEVTPEKRYRMRASTKLARAATDSETDKENKIKPKRRKLWNNDKELFNSTTSRASEVKPPIPKPVEDSSRDTTDSDTEFKRKVREQLARKSKQRATAAERQRAAGAEAQRATRSSMRGPAPLKEQNTADKRSPAAGGSESPRRGTRASDRGLRVPRELQATDSSDSSFEARKTSSVRKPTLKNKAPKLNKSNGSLIRNEKGQFVKAAKSAAAPPAGKPIKMKASSVPAGREYTSMEDHAIVAWVSGGGRERRVNGNALWRELQSAYTAITGQTRSWHSLRNRYLRYLLPSLGRLALPPAHASRLRAAAAAGVIKISNVRQRRNSIFSAPAVRSASAVTRPLATLATPVSATPVSATPVPATPVPETPSPETPAPAAPKRASPAKRATTPAKQNVTVGRRTATPVKAAPPAPSPSYSAVTRRFRTRASAPLSPSPSASASASGSLRRRPRI